MGLKILCAGHLVRHPVGGHTWHHLQYLVGLKRMGHEVLFVENYGWWRSCYDPVANDMTNDPSTGIAYLVDVLKKFDLQDSWTFFAGDGTVHGQSREKVAQFSRDCDLMLNLSNMSWVDEFAQCRRKALVDTDPVFTQIGGHGMGPAFTEYDVLFTYGENVHKPDAEMPTAGMKWLPTRQPVVLDAWPATPGPVDAPITTVVNWSAYGGKEFEGKIYGQKDQEFPPFMDLPKRIGRDMLMCVSAPQAIKDQLLAGGWRIGDTMAISRSPWTYQQFIQQSHAEFCVAKHGYVISRSGWFSDRTSAYLASGRPAVVQDTGFSNHLPTGKGLIGWRTPDEAVAGLESLKTDYAGHCKAARGIAEEYFDARRVLGRMLTDAGVA